MGTTLLLIRHGETAWNRSKVFRGTHDVPLNDNGREQARLASQSLAKRQIDAAYSSPLQRATETARIVLQAHDLAPAACEGLLDFNYGKWTGVTDEEVAKKWPDEHAQWISAPHTLRPAGGDTLAEVSARVVAAVEKIVAQHENQTIALFAHRVVNKLLILNMLGLGLERFEFIRQDNGCVNEFQRACGGYVVICLNDVSHIREGGADLLQADF